jgi:DMSO/TMAO reductase YedYZ heme-binding membrane subunit
MYATLRYHLFGGVSWSQLPLYTINKAISLSAAILFAASYLSRDRAKAVERGLAAFVLAVLHSFMSLALLTPVIYPTLYVESRLNLEGGLAVLAGCLALVFFAMLAVSSIPGIKDSLAAGKWRSVRRLGYAALLLTGVHAAAIGIKTWMRPETWPGGLPPITMLSVLATLAPLARKLRQAVRGSTRRDQNFGK